MMNSTVQAVDPITIEVARHKLMSSAEEMQITLLQSAFSPIVKEGMDCSAALFTPGGEMIAQAAAIPVHLSIMLPALAAILDRFPTPSMKPGDSYVLNDPYCGGTHLPDLTVFKPIFDRGAVVAFAGTTVHHQDVGGLTPGSIPTNAREIFHEGLRLPPIRLGTGGEIDETVESILRINSRTPDAFIGDVHAQLAACAVGERRISELVSYLGRLAIGDVFDNLLDRSEAMTRLAIRSLPNGVYEGVDYLDDDGIDHGVRIAIKVKVTVDDETLTFDLSETADQVRGPVNCVPSGARAAAYFVTRAITGGDIPSNSGCFRAVSVILREGSLVHPLAPAPVNARNATIKRMCGAMLQAFAKAIPERVPAGSGGALVMLAAGGKNADGSPFFVSELIASGSGASAGSDGVDCLQTDGSNSMNLPVEMFMAEAPIRIRRFEIRANAGGVGRRRGGGGVLREYESLVDGVRITYRGERHSTPAAGAAGGGDGTVARASITRRDGRIEPLHSKCECVLDRGDRMIIETAGGGGYGLPETQTADLVDAALPRAV